MPFTPIPSHRRSNAVVHQLERLILHGALRPGDRLPPERDLADRLSVSRRCLRDAIDQLISEGLLESEPNARVHVARDLAALFPAPLAALLARHQDAITDYLSFRTAFSGLLVQGIVNHAGTFEIAHLHSLCDDLVAALHDNRPKSAVDLYMKFMISLGEVAQNILVQQINWASLQINLDNCLALHMRLFSKPVAAREVASQMGQFMQALNARDEARASEILRLHGRFIETAYRGHQRRAQRDDVALRHRL